MKKSILLGSSLVFFGFAALAAGCSGSSEDIDPIAAAALREDRAYMRSLFAARDDGADGAMKIDLSDERQFRFLQGRLRASGITPETAGRLFQGLSAARERALALKNPKPGDKLAATSVVEPPRCNMFLVGTKLDSTQFDSLARASCVNGAVYTYVDQYQFDEAGNVLGYDFEEEWNNGIATDLTLSSAPPAAPVWADAIAYQETATTVESYYFVSGLYDNHIDPGTQLVGEGSLSPQAIGGGSASAVGPSVTGTLAAPVKLTGDNLIKLCLERNTGSNDCDYKHTTSGACAGNSLCNNANVAQFPVFPVPYNGNNLYVPFAGATPPAIADSPGNPYVVQYAKGWLTMRTAGSSTPAGGFCEADFSTAPYIQKSVTAGSPRLSLVVDKFAPMLGNGTWPSHCVDNGREVDFDVEIKMRQQNCTPTEKNECRGPVFSFSTRPSPVNPAAAPVSIVWGCLPAGSAITLADGSKVAIEKVTVGQQVLADEHGRKLTVVDLVEGTEQRPFVRIVDDRGHFVTVTSTHAMPLGDGNVVQAQELHIGDRIPTNDGPATVVAIDRPEMAAAVYNLVLGTSDELEAMGPEGTTMYADGVKVGDSRLQGYVVERKHAEAAGREEAVPEAFREDFRQSKIREAARAARH